MATTANNAPAGQTYQTAVDRNTKPYRSAILSPGLFWFGAIVWLVGACAQTVEPRFAIVLGDEVRLLVAQSLYIIASAIWILSSIISIVAASAEAALVRVGNRTPGLARVLIWSAVLEFIGSCCILVGSAAALSGYKDADNATNQLNRFSGAGIVWTVGGAFWLVAMLLQFVVALIVAAATILMAETLHRQRAWFGIAATIINTVGWVFWVIGAASAVVLAASGFLLFTAVLWIIAASLWFIAGIVRMHGTAYYFVPILAYATAAASVSGIVAGTAAQPGLTAAHNSTVKQTTTSTATTTHTENAGATLQPAPSSGAAAPVAPGSVQVAV